MFRYCSMRNAESEKYNSHQCEKGHKMSEELETLLLSINPSFFDSNFEVLPHVIGVLGDQEHGDESAAQMQVRL